jgi:hypothetical protein
MKEKHALFGFRYFWLTIQNTTISQMRNPFDKRVVKMKFKFALFRRFVPTMGGDARFLPRLGVAQ